MVFIWDRIGVFENETGMSKRLQAHAPRLENVKIKIVVKFFAGTSDFLFTENLNIKKKQHRQDQKRQLLQIPMLKSHKTRVNSLDPNGHPLHGHTFRSQESLTSLLKTLNISFQQKCPTHLLH